ncbi:helix-turn-helix domain-containing protein [Streptomyces nitrosporeus]|uniref:helix-turn-helix domain-containing protein n=2 Tax=Streptomyces nitrosporeus TaxID=28894 RepID=UPI0019AC425B|nr:transcriptional regulator [Streptomyces nitrosporeus]
MPKRRSDSGGEASARRMLHETLGRLRERSGLSLEELHGETTYDRSYLHKLETGARLGSPEVMAALDKVYGTGNQLQQLWELARDDAFGSRYQRFMQLEREATVQYKYACSTIPGLLQTQAYATEVLGHARPRDATELQEDVAARMSRQSVLDGEDVPYFRAVLDEAVFRRAASQPAVWLEQLETLLEWQKRPNVTLQALPFSAGLHDLMGGSLTVLWLANGKAVSYLEGSKSGELIEEPGRVEELRLSYDLLRDKALSPERTTEFIQQLIKEIRTCDPADPT